MYVSSSKKKTLKFQTKEILYKKIIFLLIEMRKKVLIKRNFERELCDALQFY